MKVKNERGEEFELTLEEEKFLKAIKCLAKMKTGRLQLFGDGTLTVRFGGQSSYRTIYQTSMSCAGGDGGDDFD
jgi:hypothetical protein